MGILAINGGEKIRTKPFALGTAIIGEEERQRVNEVLDSGILSGFVAKAGPSFLGGKQVQEFESLLKGYFNVPYAVAINSATAGLHAAVVACGLKAGDEVIVPPFTMSASATAIAMAGGVPIFADINERTFCLDPKSIRQRITPRTKGILVVHLYGGTADMDAVMAIAKEHKLFVVEDCAQAPGAKYKGQLVGTFGHAGVFSLNQHKTITCGEGGFVITKDKDIALRMQLVRNHGEVVVADMPVQGGEGIIGYNYRMTELEAAVSIGQFKNLDTWNTARRQLAEYLSQQLSRFDVLEVPYVPAHIEHVYFVVPVKLKSERLGISREILLKAITAEGIPFGGGYVRPIYWEPMYQGNKAVYFKGLCPVCERMHQKELMMTPVCRYPNTKEDMDDVVRAFEKVLSNLNELKEMALT